VHSGACYDHKCEASTSAEKLAESERTMKKAAEDIRYGASTAGVSKAASEAMLAIADRLDPPKQEPKRIWRRIESGYTHYEYSECPTQPTGDWIELVPASALEEAKGLLLLVGKDITESNWGNPYTNKKILPYLHKRGLL